jgi:hypothetical protein
MCLDIFMIIFSSHKSIINKIIHNSTGPNSPSFHNNGNELNENQCQYHACCGLINSGLLDEPYKRNQETNSGMLLL